MGNSLSTDELLLAFFIYQYSGYYGIKQDYVKIQGNFIFFLLTLILIPQLILAIIMVVIASKTIDTQIIINAKNSLTSTAEGISNYIGKIHDFSLEFAVHPITQELALAHNTRLTNRSYWLKNNLDRTVDNYGKSIEGIYSISVYTKENQIYQKGPAVSEDHGLYDTVFSMAGEPLWSPSHRLKLSDGSQSPTLISLYRAVNNLNYLETLAVERISLLEGSISAEYAASVLWDDELSLLFDRDLRVISSSHKDYIGRTIAQLADLDSLSGTAGYLPGVDYKFSKKEYTVFFVPVPDTDWFFARAAPSAKIFRVRHVIINFIVGSFIIYLIFGLFFFMIQERKLVVPLRRLACELNRMDKWNFAIDPNSMPNNELRQLSVNIGIMTSRMYRSMKEIYSLKIKEHESRLSTLESHINPHFLYNTLDSIRWLAVHNKDFEVSQQLEYLSKMFFHVLNKGNEITTVGDELEHIKNYMAIQQFRFGDRMRLELDVDPETVSCPCLKLILQPLVENAVTHGLEKREKDGLIQVSVKKERETIHCLVRDNGTGADEQKIRALIRGSLSTSSYSALKNIHERLRLQYGEAAGMDFSSSSGDGSAVSMSFPANLEVRREIAYS